MLILLLTTVTAQAQTGIDEYLLCGVQVTALAEPDPGYRFTGWSDGVQDNPRQFYLYGDMDITAQFARECRELLFPIRIVNPWTLTADLTELTTVTGLVFRAEDIRWYRVVGTQDGVAGKGDDIHVYTGAVFTIEQWEDGERDYYAVIDPASPTSAGYCSPLAKTRIITCNVSDGTTRELYLRPNYMRMGEGMKLIGLYPSLTTRIVMLDITGKRLQEFDSTDLEELDLTAPMNPGWYVLYVENERQQESMYFVVLE